MKKSLIALAALSAFATAAQAQSSVTVSGRIDMGFADKTLNPVALDTAATVTAPTLKTAGDLKTKDIKGSPMYTSFLRLNGSEDIGGGLKANFFLETSLSPTSGNTALGDRGMFVELAGGFGSLRAGTQNTISRDVWIQNSQTGAINIVGDLNSSTAEDAGGTAGVNGFETAIKYTTPSFNGLTASAAITSATVDTAGVKTGSDGSSFGLSYAAGKFAAIAGYSKSTAVTGAVTTAASTAYSNIAAGTVIAAGAACNTSGVAIVANTATLTGLCATTTAASTVARYETDTTITAVGANYDFGVAKVGLTYIDREQKRSTSATEGLVDRQTTTLSAQTQNLGKVVLFGSYGIGDQVTGTSTYKGDLTAMQVGVKYNLSKRTQAYLATGKVEHELSATLKNDFKETAVGIVHVF